MQILILEKVVLREIAIAILRKKRILKLKYDFVGILILVNKG